MSALAQRITEEQPILSLTEEMNVLVQEAMEKTGAPREAILLACMERGLSEILRDARGIKSSVGQEEAR